MPPINFSASALFRRRSQCTPRHDARSVSIWHLPRMHAHADVSQQSYRLSSQYLPLFLALRFLFLRSDMTYAYKRHAEVQMPPGSIMTCRRRPADASVVAECHTSVRLGTPYTSPSALLALTGIQASIAFLADFVRATPSITSIYFEDAGRLIVLGFFSSPGESMILAFFCFSRFTF